MTLFPVRSSSRKLPERPFQHRRRQRQRRLADRDRYRIWPGDRRGDLRGLPRRGGGNRDLDHHGQRLARVEHPGLARFLDSMREGGEVDAFLMREPANRNAWLGEVPSGAFDLQVCRVL